jgi:hypothetical protein
MFLVALGIFMAILYYAVRQIGPHAVGSGH